MNSCLKLQFGDWTESSKDSWLRSVTGDIEMFSTKIAKIFETAGFTTQSDPLVITISRDQEVLDEEWEALCILQRYVNQCDEPKELGICFF